MKRLMFDLALRTVTTKVSADSWDRVRDIAKRLDMRQQDVATICFLYFPEEEIRRIRDLQEEALSQMSKPGQNLLKNIDNLSAEEREILRKALDD